MVWTVRLVSEDGATLAQTASTGDGALARAQALADIYPRIAEIDPYGDTTFNGLQVPALLEELTRLMEETEEPSELQWLLDLRDFGERCRTKPHTYLKLLGD
ncbi:MAG TPA: hypothetical protein VHY18_13480 [Solirubrobacteraceae bacterium]|jgi:hypothetical protein|nr:hypothetical protein [Solirubrobacteraceae bacterium]